MFELKESDLPELERLAKGGYEWIAKDWNEQVYAYTAKPFKNTTTWGGGVKCEKIIGLGINSQIGVHWSDPEPLNVSAAIAQIKAQSHAKAHGTQSGCEWCNSGALDGYALEMVMGKYPKISGRMSNGSSIRSDQKSFGYCPNCGRRLGESPAEGEK